MEFVQKYLSSANKVTLRLLINVALGLLVLEIFFKSYAFSGRAALINFEEMLFAKEKRIELI